MAKRNKKRKNRKPAGGGAFGSSKQKAQTSIATHQRDMSQFMGIIQEQMANLEFDSDAEAQAYMQENFLSRPIEEVLAEHRGDEDNQIERLLELARNTSDTLKAKKLARQALEIDPDCFEAKIVLAERNPIKKRIKELRRVIGDEKNRLQATIDEARQNNLGLWGFHQCRPWMDAQFNLAETFELNAEVEQAIEVLEYLFELNPMDNQGVRFNLLTNYLIVGRFDDAETLLGKGEILGCDLLYGNAYLQFAKALKESDIDDKKYDCLDELVDNFEPQLRKNAEKALEKAITNYPWSLLFLTDDRILEFECDHFQFGSPQESAAAAFRMMRLWFPGTVTFSWGVSKGMEQLKKPSKNLKNNLLKHSEMFNQFLHLLEEIPQDLPTRGSETEALMSLGSQIHQLLVKGSNLSHEWVYDEVA